MGYLAFPRHPLPWLLQLPIAASCWALWSRWPEHPGTYVFAWLLYNGAIGNTWYVVARNRLVKAGLDSDQAEAGVALPDTLALMWTAGQARRLTIYRSIPDPVVQRRLLEVSQSNGWFVIVVLQMLAWVLYFVR